MIIKSPFPDPPPLPETNVHNIFFNRPEQAQWADFTLLIDAPTGKRRGYREFVERVRDAATALGAPVAEGGLGLRGEDEIVGIMSENSMDYIALVQASLAITTPFALISSYSTPFELKHALNMTKVTRLFVDAKLLPIVLPVAKAVGLSSKRIYLLQGHVKGRKSLGDMIREVKTKGIKRQDVRPAKRDTLAYLVLSSGTSGLPKAVMISHGNIIYTIGQSIVLSEAAAAVHTPPTPSTPEGFPVMLGFLPMHHTYGLHAHCFRSFLVQCSTVVVPKWELKSALKHISNYRVTHLLLIPSVVHQIVNHPAAAKADFSSVLHMNSGAAYLPTELSRKMSSLVPARAIFIEGYGMSEATIAAITQPLPGTLGYLKRYPGCTGVLYPGMEARIVDEDGSDCEVNKVGELWLRAPNVALGYWNNEKANKGTFVDGWLKTGDQFRVDAERYFYFADRSKDTLKISGSQVSPVEIEDVLLAHPDKLIVDVSVAGVSGGRTSDEKVPRAWIVLSESGKKRGTSEVVKALEAWHQENLSKYKWLRGGIEVVREIPKSPTGKTLRRVLQDGYEQRLAKKVKSKL
ncbi:acetyl-CoA synthetase-like protein [Pluteus cervinus]|uniref:Acetyl-CoA synthetase-like protein n=1 Tax=Pluteus cervinus TaxID=181527 RepID=A0ACD3AUE4_9AGAR|nr:acetyl-CoA synthetase-like protein [Pluteus cervinus]